MSKLDHLIGEKCTVHMNLHKKLFTLKFNCYLREEKGEKFYFTKKENLRKGENLKKSNRVVAHLTDCSIFLTSLHVNEKARQKVIDEKCRSVHAWAKGIFLGAERLFESDFVFSHPISYNPYKSPYYYFILPHGELMQIERPDHIRILYFEGTTKKAFSLLPKTDAAYKKLTKGFKK